jgi:hypothetical protein
MFAPFGPDAWTAAPFENPHSKTNLTKHTYCRKSRTAIANISTEDSASSFVSSSRKRVAMWPSTTCLVKTGPKRWRPRLRRSIA